MPGDVPLLDRLAQLTPVPAAEAASLVERLDEPNADPVIGPLFGTDEEGDTVVNPLVPAVLQALAQKEGLTCYAALLEGLTGIWNAAGRGLPRPGAGRGGPTGSRGGFGRLGVVGPLSGPHPG